MTDLENMRAYLERARTSFDGGNFEKASAAAALAAAFAAAARLGGVAEVVWPHPDSPEAKGYGPAPKGYGCAAGCGHTTSAHREHGCDVGGCDCPAPFGRIVQPDTPDDLSGLTR